MVANCTQADGSCGGSPPGTAPAELITAMYYGYPNYSHICVNPIGSSCQVTLLSLDSVYFNMSGTYPIKAVTSSGSGLVFGQWMSNAGTFANKNSASTAFTVTGWGYIGFSVERIATEYWGGYIAGMQGNNDLPMVVSAASGEFYVPNPTWVTCSRLQCADTGETLSIWVGIGSGFTGSDIWQAGVDVNIGWINGQATWGTWIDPWYEYFTPSSSGSVSVYNSIGTIYPGDLVQVIVGTVSIGGSLYPSFEISDLTRSTSVSGNLNLALPLPSDSAEWVGEDPQDGALAWGMSARAVLPSTPAFHFLNPTLTASCGPVTSCPSLGTNSWLSPVEAMTGYSMNPVSSALSIGQQLTASQLYNGLDEYNVTYS
jgi:hypothetical protein